MLLTVLEFENLKIITLDITYHRSTGTYKIYVYAKIYFYIGNIKKKIIVYFYIKCRNFFIYINNQRF